MPEYDTYYVREYNGHGSLTKFHTDEDCQYIQRCEDYREYTHEEFVSRFSNLELCKWCDDEYEVDHSKSNTTSRNSILEEAMANGDVPDDLTNF